MRIEFVRLSFAIHRVKDPTGDLEHLYTAGSIEDVCDKQFMSVYRKRVCLDSYLYTRGR